MIVVDIETSGRYFERHGIWQIGALDFFNPASTFLEECRIDNEDEIEEGATKVHGKDEAYLRDSTKQPQRKLLENFFAWCAKAKVKNLLCHNPQFDREFINFKARKYGLRSSYSGALDEQSPFHHRSFDLHTVAQIRYFQIHGRLLLEADHSEMGLSNIMKFCGILYERKEHNALEDARLTAECFSRLMYGKSLVPEYAHHKIPEVLHHAA